MTVVVTVGDTNGSVVMVVAGGEAYGTAVVVAEVLAAFDSDNKASMASSSSSSVLE